MAIWHILWPFGNLVAIGYIFPRFGLLCQDLAALVNCGDPSHFQVKSLNDQNEEMKKDVQKLMLSIKAIQGDGQAQ
jgi:hypothetical protein